MPQVRNASGQLVAVKLAAIGGCAWDCPHLTVNPAGGYTMRWCSLFSERIALDGQDPRGFTRRRLKRCEANEYKG